MPRLKLDLAEHGLDCDLPLSVERPTGVGAKGLAHERVQATSPAGRWRLGQAAVGRDEDDHPPR